MSHIQAASGPLRTVMFLRRLRGAAGHVRVTVIVCLVLICGSFASAALIQMRLDRTHALSQAAMFGARRAQEMASDLSATLSRYQAIGAAFASAGMSAETSAALSEAGGAPLRNIAELDWNGQLKSEMTGAPRGFLPLSAAALAEARRGRTILPSADGRTLAVIFPATGALVAVQLDSSLLVPAASMEDGLLASPSGDLFALGARWRQAPPGPALALADESSASRIVRLDDGARLVSLQRVEGWPLVVGASARVDDALGAWYGALPLYFFFILGPALAGAALAALFVRVFERQAKTAAAVKALKSTRPDEARLLVRLADAERRAVEAERSQARFIAQVSHELRTPLNAIIGFAETIESGVFGAPGHAKYVEYARDIGVAGHELHARIGSVLEYAAAGPARQSSRAKDAIAAIEVCGIVRATIAQRAARARTRGLKLVVSVPEKAEALADVDSVARIVGHVLDNALAYTPKGGAVRVFVRADARAVVIGIRDSGLGFSAGEKARACRPFQRFPRPDSSGGMGLGLATAMALARRMDATLNLSSIAGEGTLAELRLPAAPG